MNLYVPAFVFLCLHICKCELPSILTASLFLCFAWFGRTFKLPFAQSFLYLKALFDSQVSAFSTWEKELHKIVFDPRYLLLTSRERKQVFETYVKERAEEERREKHRKLREKKDSFRQLLEESKLHGK